MTLMLQEIASYSALLIAVLQLVFVVLFGLFFRKAVHLKEEVEAIMEYLVSADQKFREVAFSAHDTNEKISQALKRQNTLARLIIRNQSSIVAHHKASRDFLDNVQAGIDSGEIRLVRIKDLDISQSQESS